MPLLLTRPELGAVLENVVDNDEAIADLTTLPNKLESPNVRFFVAALVAVLAVGVLAMSWLVVLISSLMLAGAFAFERFGRVSVLTRIARAQASARKFASHVGALDRATLRALRALQECQLLARGRRVSSTLLSQMDDAANAHRNAVLLAAVASGIARIRHALSAAVDEWRAQLRNVACVSALVTVSDRRVSSLQGQIAAITDECIATLDSLAPTLDSPPVSLASLKQLHHVNCAIRSHLMTLLLLAADEPRRAMAIGRTLDGLARQLAPLAVRIDSALDTFVLVSALPQQAPTSAASANDTVTPPQRRSRRRFQSQLANSRDLVSARLVDIGERLRQTHQVSEQSDDADVTADDVNVAYRQFRRVRDDLREALYEWERAHAPLATILSVDGAPAWRHSLEASKSPDSPSVVVDNDSDVSRSDNDDDVDLLVDEKQFEHDGAVANDDAGERSVPLTREERMARMAQRQAEREQREAAQAKQRRTMELIDELSQVLQHRAK